MKKIIASALILGAFATASMAAEDGSKLYKTCIACHGAKAEKQYQNKVPALSSLSAEEIVKALNEYKAGSRNAYGLGGVMKAQASRLDEAKMQAIAEYINTLK